MKQLLTIISLIFILSCSNQRKDNIDFNYINQDVHNLISYLVENKEIKPFMSDNIRILDSLPSDVFAYEFLDMNLIDTCQIKINSYLNEFNIKKRNLSPVKIRIEDFNNIEFIDSSLFEEILQVGKPNKPFYIIYSPIISNDGNVAIVSIDQVCFGLCGSGWSLILKKEDNKWKKLCYVFRWIS